LNIAAPPSTFVPADDNIFPPVGYGAMWLVLGLVAGLLGLALVVWCLRTVPRESAAKLDRSDVPAVKAHYLAEIEELEREFAAHHMDERELHHRLSRTVREFAADLGEPGAVAMTAALLEEAGLTSVALAVAGYQEPQFMERAVSDPPGSCSIAKGVIEQW